MNYLRFVKLEFQVIAVKDFTSQGYAGNKLRGAIGMAMNKLFCDTDKAHCENCNNYCVYGEVFKPIEKNPGFTTSPAPFVLEMSRFDKAVIKKGERLGFNISIFGERIIYWRDLLEAVIYSFTKDDKVFNASFKIEKVMSQIERDVIWENNGILAVPKAIVWSDDEVETVAGYSFDEMKIKVKFNSPLLLKNEPTKEWSFTEFIEAVFYRIGSIIDLYEENRFYVLYGLLNRKPYIKTDIISLRDNKPEFILEGDLRKHLPYIDIGSHLHIGKKSTYGFGHYEFEIIK